MFLKKFFYYPSVVYFTSFTDFVSYRLYIESMKLLSKLKKIVYDLHNAVFAYSVFDFWTSILSFHFTVNHLLQIYIYTKYIQNIITKDFNYFDKNELIPLRKWTVKIHKIKVNSLLCLFSKCLSYLRQLIFNYILCSCVYSKHF